MAAGSRHLDLARRRGWSPTLVLFTLLVLLGVLFPTRALASDGGLSSCEGPSQCCPPNIELSGTVTHAVQIGAVIVGIYEVNEKASSWMADFYLYETWDPAPGFVPQTEIVNEVERKAVQFEATEMRDGHCLRTRRVHSTLRTDFNLRTFPFDYQNLTLQVSDAEFPSSQVRYADKPIAGIDESVFHQLTDWKVMPGLRYERTAKSFRWDPGAPDYDYATFSVSVRRHVTYHESRYFLPLLLIVIVSFSVFWIDASDLASEVQISVTCLLAAIALQFAEGNALPAVSYLTLADRAYATSYVAIALSVLQVVFTDHLMRTGRDRVARTVDRWSRVLFPAGLVLALVTAVLRAYAQAD